MKSIQRTIEIEPTPAELARYFVGLYSDQQVEFFNECAKALKEQYITKWIFQLQYIVGDGTGLTPEGRHFMSEIGQYADYDQKAA